MKKIIYHDQMGFIPGMQHWLDIWKPIRFVHHINSVKKKDLKLVLIGVEKTSEKIYDKKRFL